MCIGIFDSGVGGLTVWRELRRVMGGRFIYFGDTAHVPYGEKSPEQLMEYFWDIIDFFQQREVKAVVVACNTMSAVVLPKVQDQVPLKLFGMIDAAVDAAVKVSHGKVGVLATSSTAASGAYEDAFGRIRPTWDVTSQGCPRLVPLIEAGRTSGPEVEKAVAEYVKPLKNAAVDTIVLGCTHYPFVTSVIEHQVGSEIAIVDPAIRIGQEVSAWFGSKNEIRVEDGSSHTEFWVSRNPKGFQTLARQFMGTMIPNVNLYEMAGEAE